MTAASDTTGVGKDGGTICCDKGSPPWCWHCTTVCLAGEGGGVLQGSQPGGREGVAFGKDVAPPEVDHGGCGGQMGRSW